MEGKTIYFNLNGKAVCAEVLDKILCLDFDSERVVHRYLVRLTQNGQIEIIKPTEILAVK